MRRAAALAAAAAVRAPHPARAVGGVPEGAIVFDRYGFVCVCVLICE